MADDNNNSDADLETEFAYILAEIASSRPDSYVPLKRRLLVERATEMLREEASARRLLAEDIAGTQHKRTLRREVE
jgi:hypothetical protein